MYDDLDRPPLNRDALRRALLTPGSLWSDLQILPVAASTNAVLAERARSDDRSGLIVIAEQQTAGRGRLDRSWVAPPRAGLTMSVLVRPIEVAVSRWPWIGLLAGLAVAATLREVAEVEAQLKWPNDVMVADDKIAGLLVERVEAHPHPPAAVIGIGLNVSMRADELPVSTATSLAIVGAATTDRSVLARGVLRTLEGLLGDWQRSGGDPDRGLRRAYVQACRTIGRRVRVALPGGGQIEGDAVDVDSSGRLVVDAEAGREVVGAGDVVHLRTLA